MLRKPVCAGYCIGSKDWAPFVSVHCINMIVQCTASTWFFWHCKHCTSMRQSTDSYSQSTWCGQHPGLTSRTESSTTLRHSTARWRCHTGPCCCQYTLERVLSRYRSWCSKAVGLYSRPCCKWCTQSAGCTVAQDNLWQHCHMCMHCDK